MKSTINLEAHKGMLVKLAKRYTRPGIEREDLIAEGYIGMIEAERTFDSSKGAFATHAFYQVRARMLEYARSFARAGSAFKGRAGRKAFLNKEIVIAHDACLDAAVTEDGATLGEIVASDEASPEAQVIEAEQASLLTSMVSTLEMDEREAALWTNMMTDEPETLEVIAKRFGVSKQRMGQIAKRLRTRAQRTLRHLA